MSKDKAREFWIDENWAVGACDEMHLCVYDKEVDGIHVIEHAAYAALESKLAELMPQVQKLVVALESIKTGGYFDSVAYRALMKTIN